MVDIEFENLNQAWEYVTRVYELGYAEYETAFNLNDATASDFRKAADDLENMCCGRWNGVVVIAGEPWYLGTSYGH